MSKQQYKQYARALYEVTKDISPKELDIVLDAFVVLLSRNNILKKSSLILKEFEHIAKKEAGEVSIKIISARALQKKTIEKISHAFGNTTSIETEIDKSVIGGVQVYMEDKIFDASIRSHLQQLKQTLS